MNRLLLILAGCLPLTLAVTGGGEPVNVAVFYPREAGPGWQLIRQLDDVREVPADSLLRDANGILIFNSPRPPAADQVEQLRARFAEFLNRGGSLVLGLAVGSSHWDRQSENSPDAGQQREERRAEFWDAQLGTLLPVNPWSAYDNRLKRLSTGATAPAGSPLAAALKTPGFHMDWRFDLHLPYSTVEAGQHRYEPAHFGKELWNTDWHVLLNADQDGRLPLLVGGRYGAGQVFVFAGDLLDGALPTWAGYETFMRALLAAAAPVPADAGADDVTALKLDLPMVQSGGPLTVTVTNPTGRAVRATLAVKIRNFTGSVRNAYTQPLTVAANAAQKIPLVTVSEALRGDLAPRAADRASEHLLRVEAGLATADRRQPGATVAGLVDLTPAVTVRIEGENVNGFEKVEGWTVGGVGISGGNSIPVERYTYFCGDTPKLNIRVANARHNLAPLARAADHAWPENPSVEGLNNTAYSYENIRHKQPAVFAYWVGKRNDQYAQQLSLHWPLTVTAAAQRLAGQGDYRRYHLNNPKNFTLAAGGDAPLLEVSDAAYVFAIRDDEFPAPAAITSCTLTITGLDPKAPNEPKLPNTEVNGVIDEWEIYGWPAAQLPPAVSGTLRVTLSDPATGAVTTLAEQPLTVEPLREQTVTVSVPSQARTATVRVDAEFLIDNGKLNIDHLPQEAATAAPKAEAGPVRKWLGRFVKKDPADTAALATAANAPAPKSPIINNQSSIINSPSFPLLFIPANRPHVLTRDLLGAAQIGFLCSPGFVALDQFGKGARDDTQGWGGPDDKVWAWAHDLMEIGSRNKDEARYFYLAPARLSHYTGPWRDFPSGRYVWDWATDHLLDRFANRDWKGKTSLHVVGSDRWNGIPIGASFTWANYIRFDQYLRAQGQPGLPGRTRAAINRAITEEYADEFQRYELNRYADELLKSQQRFADAGIRFSFESHGSFPLSGGAVGAKLGQTHKAVGTDLFWELRDEDLYKSLGYRYGVVAANPDFESGAYNEWGWVSGVLGNSTWFSVSGDVEPARRQWYSTYYAGRVTSGGEFKPYTVYGFSNQGGVGTKMTLDDWQNFNRAQSRMIWQRPDRPVGFGLVASWQLQEHRLTPAAGPLGFGLFAGKGYDQVNELVGELYHRLVKNSVPVSFFASTHTLKDWRGVQPLIVVDGFETDPWELAELERLNRAGAPVIAVGGQPRENRPAAEQFFGAKYTAAGWLAAADTKVVNDSAGQPFAYIYQQRLFCPVPVRELDGQQSALLAKLILDLCGDPLIVSPGGLGTTAFANDGSLYLILGSQSDSAQTLTVSVNPRRLDPAQTATRYRVIDLDRVIALPAEERDGTLTFTLPCGPNDGRMVQLLPLD
ncbi:MAG: hypothetical protein LBK71_05890 [Verrucomicrobiales bacterium]|jgi:hypothetical protein|nr:hypothetical protein [Verrucomicrobiales bacterium]